MKSNKRTEPTAGPSLGAVRTDFEETLSLTLESGDLVGETEAAYDAAPYYVVALEAAARDLLDVGVWETANEEVRCGAE